MKKYEQEYKVTFDLHPFEVGIGIYHQAQTELTREEIVEEALDVVNTDLIGNMPNYNHLEERDIIKIELITKEEVK